jgi:putative ABC transport system permease protein
MEMGSEAMASTTGMAVMVASFDHTMRGWIDRTMQADIYISSAGAQSASSTHFISAKTVVELGKELDVAELAYVQARMLLWKGGEVLILGTDPMFAHKHGLYAWVEAPAHAEWWQTNDGITPAIMSESWSERFETKVGDVIELVGRKVRVVAMNAEYGNERGSLTLPAVVFREWFETDEAWRVALMLKPGADAEMTRDRIQNQHPGLSVFTNAHLRSEALRIFRQTFSVTYALEVIGVIVRARIPRRLACRLPNDSRSRGRTITSKTTSALTGLVGSRNVGTPSAPSCPKPCTDPGCMAIRVTSIFPSSDSTVRRFSAAAPPTAPAISTTSARLS